MTSLFDVQHTPSNPFFTIIKAFLNSAELASAPMPVPASTAAHLVHTITTCSNPAHALWQLWDAFFTTVATTPTSHAALLTLYFALSAQPPTQPDSVPVGSDAERQLRSHTHADGTLHWATLPRFGSQWHDVHDILEARRDRNDVCVSSYSADELYLHFCTFSALLLKTTNGKGELHPIRVFYACRSMLECKPNQTYPVEAHRISPERTRALDVGVAAIWVRDLRRALWETDHGELRQHWATALDEKTDLWPRGVGLTKQRWRLWEERLRALSLSNDLDMRTRTVVMEAARVVADLLDFGQA